jgi:hypothetical protein
LIYKIPMKCYKINSVFKVWVTGRQRWPLFPSSVWMTGESVFNCLHEFLFTTMSKLALGPTSLPLKGYQGLFP